MTKLRLLNLVRGAVVVQEATKILTYIENHWEDPACPECPPRDALVGETFEMLGRLTDEYGNPMAKRTVGLTIIDPDGTESTVFDIVCDHNGVMRWPIVLNIAGLWSARYWFGGDETYNPVEGTFVYQGVRKILSYIENHWEGPDPTAPPGPLPTSTTAYMLGRLTDEFVNPMAKRTVALHIIEPDGVEYDIHGIVCDDDGVMRQEVPLTKQGVWRAYYWFGGDETYEGCPESEWAHESQFIWG